MKTFRRDLLSQWSDYKENHNTINEIYNRIKFIKSQPMIPYRECELKFLQELRASLHGHQNKLINYDASLHQNHEKNKEIVKSN